MLQRCFTIGFLVGSAAAMKFMDGDVVGVDNGSPVNDPLYTYQEKYFEAINIPAAWKRLASAKTKRSRVTVALIDTGVERNHPDLVGNLVRGYNVIKHGTATPDSHGHGTNMAGVLGATINNSMGISGVMDLVNIMPISLEARFEGNAEAASFDYAIRNREARNIKIILMAISGYTLWKELAYKVFEADKAGMLIIVSAGNNGKNITAERKYPCALTTKVKTMLCVAGTEQSEMKLGSFSNFADYVDIAAPGRKIVTTGITKGARLHPYEIIGGTSPAAAIIAGVAAMLYSVSPGISATDVKKILKDTSAQGLKDSSGNKSLPFGRVDVDKAVAKLVPR
ncbi:hypothetical protein FOL47_009555 [Perkinsus chesapeaki]|uniref:subtilisin n=1 Tax=Perkinsus chesapeaki TaxID=330153 RepID=A0A7J6L7K7_PERCH|nr:hypothetical protein FOL47_009555 [Perkinsus chesapeaki]